MAFAALAVADRVLLMDLISTNYLGVLVAELRDIVGGARYERFESKLKKREHELADRQKALDSSKDKYQRNQQLLDQKNAEYGNKNPRFFKITTSFWKNATKMTVAAQLYAL